MWTVKLYIYIYFFVVVVVVCFFLFCLFVCLFFFPLGDCPSQNINDWSGMSEGKNFISPPVACQP